MFKLVLSTLIFVLCLQSGLTQEEPLSNLVANYDMDIFLDVENKKIDASTKLTWKNISSDTIMELYFHLYYNAFKNAKSTFFKERGVPQWLTTDIDQECGWGWSHITEFKDGMGNDLSSRMYYVQPDDNNKDDQTVLRVDLTEPIYPGESHVFNFKWQAKVPKTMPRTGYNKDFYFFAQWFPKTGVYEPAGMRFAKEGQWNCHQYHSSGEYYADFGNYDVKMSVPNDYIVASSGELKGQSKEGDRKIWHFKGHDIIDFTWSCSPHYVLHEDTYKDTKIKFYTYPYKEYLKSRYFPTIKFCMAYLDEHLGPYPYKTLSIIDPPIHGMFTGGMEYPTIITSLSFCFFPEGIRTPETLVVHEYIHQYFMQMVATHEVEEAWMDEGMTTYYEGRILDSYLGQHTSTIDVLGVKCGNREFNRTEFFASDNVTIAPNSIKSWNYKHGGYGDIAYNKAALWLETLEGLIGVELMDKIMRSYFQKWKFKHPSRYDFIQIVNDIVKDEMSQQYPNGMDWYFDQVLYGTEVCDYKVRSISNDENESPRGFIDNIDNCSIIESEHKKYTSEVIIERKGGVQLPIEIELTFDDSTVEVFSWDGQSRSHDVTLQSDKKIIAAKIDPFRKIMLDQNLINNSLTITPQKKGIKKVLNKVLTSLQQIMESITLVI